MFGFNRSVDIQSAVKKALSPDDTAPKRKHVRACIVYTWEHKSSRAFWETLKVQPIRDSDVQLFKSLILIHKVIQEGHPSALPGGYKNIDWIGSLDTLSTQDKRYRVLVGQYVAYILRKLRFHHNHRGFNGTFEYEEYVSLSTVSDPNEGYESILDLSSLQDALDELARYILRASSGSSSECIISALVPIIAESYGIYKFLISMLRAMNRTADDPEFLVPLQDRFRQQHAQLYDLYAECSKIRYLTTLVTIPKLPFDSPSLVVSDDNVDSELPKLKEQKTSATGWSEAPSRARSESVEKPLPVQPTGAFINQQKEFEDQQQQLFMQQQQAMQQQQQEQLQQQQYWEQQQRAQAEQQAQAQQQLLFQQSQAQSQGRVSELERDVLALKGQYDNDQLMLQSYDQKVQSLEQEMTSLQQNVQQQMASKEEQIAYLTEQVTFWKNKYDSLAKLYSQLRQEHLNLLSKSKKVQQKASSAQEAIEKREKLERDMKSKNIELADLIKQRDRARLELEKFKNSSTGDYQKLMLEKDELESKLATLDRAQSANLSAIFNQHNREMQDLQQKLNSTSLDGPIGDQVKDLQEKLSEKDLEIEMMQQAMDEALADLINEQKQQNSSGDINKFINLIDAILKSGVKRIEDSVFELDSPMQAGNLNSSPEYLLTLTEKASDLSTDFASSFNSFLVDGPSGDEAAVIDTITNFTTSIGDILLNTKGLIRLTTLDDFQDDLIDTARDLALISQVFLESLYSKSLSALDLETKTDTVINGNVDVQEVLQSLQILVDSLKTPANKINLHNIKGELSDLVDNEMAHASKVIEDASIHLSNLLTTPFDPSMSAIDIEINKSILACASAIINAIKYLIQSSIESQNEIVNNGRGSNSKTSFYKKNNKWTEGLISASKSIAYTTNILIKIADGVLQNSNTNEELIVASNEVAASTAQLVSAARVKSQFMSKTQDNLEGASKKVNAACKQLVNKVSELMASKNELNEVDYSKLSIHENKTAEMEQQVEILKLENALSSARKRLGEIRKFSYRDDDSDEN